MEHDVWLAQRFEEHRARLQAVAYRMLGSLSEADDAVQEAWMRLVRADAESVENLGGWLTTVTARICLNALRSRESRREEPLEGHIALSGATHREDIDAEHEVLLADSVGLALLVVLETLAPAERLAFVLHDLFDLPFGEIAPIVGRSPEATRQLASRARRRVRGTATVPAADLARQRPIVDAFLTASRAGDFEALLAVLDPDVVLRVDRAVPPGGGPTEKHGARAVARSAVERRARAAQPALVNGAVGVVVAPRGRLLLVLRFDVRNGRIVEIDAVAEPERLRQLELRILDD